MPRKKKETFPEQMNTLADAIPEMLAGERVPDTVIADTVLEQLGRVVDIPDDKPAGISLRDRAVLHLLAGADLHRIAPDAVTHRIKRCIDIANQVVELLGEDA